jgi:ubiquinone/menaquinone biosynthesis C-methylase UbiE
VLIICAGVGNYGVRELLSRGAQVVLTDIAPEVVEATRRRWRLHPAVTCEVSDAEALPYASGSFDYVYCHAGLHHLPRPLVGVYEMYRVCREQLVFAEAQDSTTLRVLVRFGFATDWEDSGNYVYRFTRREVHKLCASLGARGYRVSTFFNQTSAVLDQRVYPRLNNAVGYRLFTAAYRVGNALFGHQGNTCVVTIFK